MMITKEQTKILLAWHSDAALQEATVAEMVAHRKADRLIKGVYWEGGKGCAVGCLIHSGDHAQYEPRFVGIPQALAKLEDTIFENLTNGEAMKWPERFLAAAKPGADLSLVQWQFLAFIVDEALARPEAQSVREACQPALEVVRAKARGEEVSEEPAWSAAWSARSAESAAWSAAWSARSARSAESAASAAWSARSAESAAWSAAWSARSAESAASAAWSAESAESAESAAWSAESAAESAWKRYADKLVELMNEAPVPMLANVA
jgi:hypothetical protein